MSWHLSVIGKAGQGLKESVAKQFEHAIKGCEQMPAEQHAVSLAHEIVQSQIDFMAALGEPSAVQITGSGSQYKSGSSGGTEFNLTVKSLYGFVE